METNTTICFQSGATGSNASIMTMRTIMAIAAIFGAAAKKAVTGVGAPFVDIGRPHVEWNSGYFEGDAGQEEDQTEDHARSKRSTGWQVYREISAKLDMSR